MLAAPDNRTLPATGRFRRSANGFYPIVGFWHHSIQEWKVWPEHLCRNFCPRTHTCVDGSPRELDANIQAWSDATRPNFNGRARVFQQAWAAEEDEAVGRWAMPFRQARSAGERRCRWLPWGFRVDKPWNVFSRRDVNRRGLSERRDFFANILFGRLHCRNVSGHLLLLAR